MVIQFERWELEDLRNAMEDAEHQDASTSYPQCASDPFFAEFLNRVVEVADAHRSRQAIKDAPHAPKVK